MTVHRKEITLNGTWKLRGEALTCGLEEARKISNLKAGWINTPVPGDIRQGLLAADITCEPTLGMNSFEASWIEDKSWWLRKTFKAAKSMIDSNQTEIVLDGLDANASIFLNDMHIGDHPSTFRPFVKRINEALVEGDNVLLVRLTHGIENVTQKEVDDVGGLVAPEQGNNNPDRSDRRRIYVRKPQYSWGWDWVPRIATVGITSQCSIRVYNKSVIRDLQITPQRKARTKNVNLKVAVEVEWFHRYKTGIGTVYLNVLDIDDKVVASQEQKALLQGGINYVDCTIEIKNAQFWWPSHMGRQYRYTIVAELRMNGKKVDSRSVKYGIRFVELDTDNRFAFRINGKTMFCKGANWIPCDALYGRVTDERVDKLIIEARKANFNMLRIWGGGLYERDAFYEACDREGILVWHDFMFACAPPPDHLECFRDEICKEADYQTRRLHNHACIALWCGSNECIGVMQYSFGRQTQNGRVTFGSILPRAVRNNCPEIPYWYSSPYGAGNNWKHGDSDAVGDCHFWTGAMMHKDMNKRITPQVYDNDCHCRFISEFGFPGPCCQESTLEYLNGGEFDRSGKVWQHHCNSFEKGTIEAAVKKHYLDPARISTSEHLYYDGLVQGLMYGYSLEAMRSKPYCGGALFWMYNDCWGEIGWTIIDYYLRRKISWYFTRRAFAPLRLILRKKKSQVVVTLANDTDKTLRGTLEYGYLCLNGKKSFVKRRKVSADAFVRTVLATFARGKYDPTRGLWFARLLGRKDIIPGMLMAVDLRALNRSKPNVELSVRRCGTDQYMVTFTSDVYAHAVELKLPAGAKQVTPKIVILQSHVEGHQYKRPLAMVTPS